MAKDKAAKAVPAPEPYKPTVYVDMEDGETKQLDGLKIGKSVTVVLRGKLIGIEKRETPDGKRGNVRLESPSVKITGSNAFTELAEED